MPKVVVNFFALTVAIVLSRIDRIQLKVLMTNRCNSVHLNSMEITHKYFAYLSSVSKKKIVSFAQQQHFLAFFLF